jgi:hypothetical protein
MDIERELLSRLDAMERHLLVVEEELIRFRRERFMKSVAAVVLIVLPLVGLGFLIPNFARKYISEHAPESARSVLQSYIQVDQEIATTAAAVKKSVPPAAVPVATPAASSSTTTPNEI